MDDFPTVRKLFSEIITEISKIGDTGNLLMSISGSPFSGKSRLARSLETKLAAQYKCVYLYSASSLAEYGVFDSSFFNDCGSLKESWKIILKNVIPVWRRMADFLESISSNARLMGETQMRIYDAIETKREDNDLLIVCDNYDLWDECSKRVVLSYMEHKRQGYIHKNNFKLVVLLISENEVNNIAHIDFSRELTSYIAKDEKDFKKYIKKVPNSRVTIQKLFKISKGNVGFANRLITYLSDIYINSKRESFNFPLLDKDKTINEYELTHWFIEILYNRCANMRETLGVLASFNGEVDGKLLFELASGFFILESSQSDFRKGLEKNIPKAIHLHILSRQAYQDRFLLSFCDTLSKSISYNEILSRYKEIVIKWHKHVASFMIKISHNNLYEICWHLEKAQDMKLAEEYYCLHCIEMCNRQEEDVNRLENLKKSSLYHVYEAIKNKDIDKLTGIDVTLFCPRLRIEINYALVLSYYRSKPLEYSSDIISICESYIDEPTIHARLRFRFAWLLMFHYVNRLDAVNEGRKVYGRIYSMCDGNELDDDDVCDIKEKMARISSAFFSQRVTHERLKCLLETETRKPRSIKDKVMLLTNLSGCEIAIGEYEQSHIHASEAFTYICRFPWYGSFKVINNYYVSSFMSAGDDEKKKILESYREIQLKNKQSLLIGMNLVCMEEIVSPSTYSVDRFALPEDERIDNYYKAIIYYNNITFAILNEQWLNAENFLSLANGLVPSICERDKWDIEVRWNLYSDIISKKKRFETYDELRQYAKEQMRTLYLWSEPYIITDLQYWSEM